LNERYTLSFESRQELVEGSAIPFVFSLGSDLKLTDGLKLKGIFAKHYALPIFDDMYWKEDAHSKGNPLLKPEYGWNYEAGVSYTIVKEAFSLFHELTFFNHHTYDLILWMPAGGDNSGEEKWMPDNMDESKSYGIEFNGNASYVLNRSAFTLRYMYSFTSALILDESQGSDPGQQRIYVPRHSASLAFGYSIQHFSIHYFQTYTGSRYYDFYHTLDSYSLADLQLGYTIQGKKAGLEINFKIRNLFDMNYQVMAGYAQPPRNFNTGLTITF
jgi:iron complex outermembrane receptor protein